MIVGFRYPRSDFKLSKTVCNGCSLNFLQLQGTVNEYSGVEKPFLKRFKTLKQTLP